MSLASLEKFTFCLSENVSDGWPGETVPQQTSKEMSRLDNCIFHHFMICRIHKSIIYIYILFKNVNWSSFVSGSHKKFQSLVCSSVCCLPWMLRQMPSPSLSAQQPVLYTFRHAWPVLTLSNDRQWGRVFLSSAVYCMSAPFRVYVSWHMLAFLPLARSVQQVNTSTAKLSSGKYAK